MNADLKSVASRITALQKRAKATHDLVQSGRDVPTDLLIDDKDMIRLEEHISDVARSITGDDEIPEGIWRPFWHASYSDWNRNDGPVAFWRAVMRHLQLTGEFIDYLQDSANPTSTTDESMHRDPEPSPVNSLDLFLSHSSKDTDLAEALIELIRAALSVSDTKIRCTSVDGYRLAVGASTNDQLRKEVHQTRAFLGLITPASITSAYVLFELGARWGAGLHLAPLTARAEGASLLRGPLSGINALDLSSTAQVHQLVQELATQLSLRPATPASYTRYIQRVIELAKMP
jgi:hypothetical protein